MQNFSSCGCLGGIFACTGLFKSFHSIWIGFWSRLWLSNSRTLNFLGRLTGILQVIATLKGSLSVHLQSSNKWSHFMLNIFLHNEEFSIMVNCPDYDAGKQPQTITFPQPCFTCYSGLLWNVIYDFGQTCLLVLWPNNSIFTSIVQNTLSQKSWLLPRCL